MIILTIMWIWKELLQFKIPVVKFVRTARYMNFSGDKFLRTASDNEAKMKATYF